MLNIVLFGAPGSGKGTQSAKLVDCYGLYHISTGDVLRDQICAHTDLGRIADKYISQGKLIPDDLMVSILEDVLENNAKNKAGVIFDGFPRTLAQAAALKKMLEKKGQKIDAVIGLEVPREELIERMLKRGKETHREDDNLETIHKRLEVYLNQTKPLQDHYKNEGVFIPVKGTGIVDEIFNEIVKGIEEKTNISGRH